MEPRERRLVIILADLSGYTKFMLGNQMAAVHGQQLITALLESILRQVKIPLVLQEIEGDAVFMYAAHPDSEEGWQAALSEIRLKLEHFFLAFLEELVSRAESTLCECPVCKHLDSLKLKIVVHSGVAVFHQIADRSQVSGVDIITAHRLLKNSVPSDEYLLMSERAYEDLGYGMEGTFDRGLETYESVEPVVTYVRLMGANRENAREEFYALSEAEMNALSRRYTRFAVAAAIPELWQHIRGHSSDAGLSARLWFSLKFLFSAPALYAKMVRGIPRHVRARRTHYRSASAP
jgi:hypothetical protein